jgi:hypothetical protein
VKPFGVASRDSACVAADRQTRPGAVALVPMGAWHAVHTVIAAHAVAAVPVPGWVFRLTCGEFLLVYSPTSTCAPTSLWVLPASPVSCCARCCDILSR